MVRRYDEAVQVRQGEQGEPHSFIWRDRLHVVREVLDHWQERRSWWREAVAPVPSPAPSHPSGPSRPVGSGDDDGTTGGLAILARERRVWRVVAAAGASAASGVYDLAEVPGADDRAVTWQLVRVSD